jgi:hypothetical protein
MKRSLLVVTLLMLACAATLAPMSSTPPMLLASAGGASWNCSTSAWFVTTCAPRADVRVTSMN